MKPTRAIASAAIAIATLAAATSTASAMTGPEQLHILLNSHVYTGQRVTQAVKNATGDPYIHVIDRRYTFGEVYRCSFTFRGNPRRRIMVCD